MLILALIGILKKGKIIKAQLEIPSIVDTIKKCKSIPTRLLYAEYNFINDKYGVDSADGITLTNNEIKEIMEVISS